MSVKLYRHNESGEDVAAVYKENGMGDKEYIRFDGTKILFDSGLVPKKFEEVYTPLPEAPEVEEWQTGEVELEDQYFWFVGQIINTPKNEIINIPCMFFAGRDGEGWMYNGDSFHLDKFKGMWKLVRQEIAPPKPIVELLPHEFVEGQECLARLLTCHKWEKIIFGGKITYDKCRRYGEKDKRQGRDLIENLGNPPNYYTYCIPYAGNEHLEGTVTDGEHGAVPKGYVPPYVPQLGDETYWMVGDEVVDLAEYGFTKTITAIKENYICSKEDDVFFYHTHKGQFITDYNNLKKGELRVLYHEGSYVREDGTVHEHVPTRPHRIES